MTDSISGKSGLQRSIQFVAAAFIITWIIGIVALLLLQPIDRMLGIEGKRISLFIGRYGPTLAAFFMMYLASGIQGMKQLFLRALIWKVHPIYYLMAIFLPFGVKLLVLYLGNAEMGSFSIVATDIGPMLMAAGTYLFFGGGFGEEFGWRGYMVPALNERYQPVLTSLIVGIVWIAWHLPAFVFDNKAQEASVEVFSVFVIATSFILTWLYYKTGQSILFVALFHGCYNATGDWVRILFGKDDGELGMSEQMLNWYEALIMLAIATLIILSTKGKLGYKLKRVG